MSVRQQQQPRALTVKDERRDVDLRLVRGRARLLLAAAALLALVGLADALYLTINHLTGQTARCTVSGGCNEVLGSSYASVGGVPIAALGAAAYFTVFSLTTLALFGYSRARVLLYLIVALMLLTSLWLLFVQAFVLHKYCDYCLLSAAVTLLLSGILVALRFIRADE
jgi:uncharacterized membrane protein